MILAQEICAIILIFCMVLAKIRYSAFLVPMHLGRFLNFKDLTQISQKSIIVGHGFSWAI